MPETKRIIVLANSRKPGGRCVAGTEWENPSTWIRPVGQRPGNAVLPREMQYPDGTLPQVGDIVDVPLSHAVPSGHQAENWLLDASRTWRHVGRATGRDLERAVAVGRGLWSSGHASGGGLHNRVPAYAIRHVRDSLRLLSVPSLELRWSARNVNGLFTHTDTEFLLRVTDPVVEALAQAQVNRNRLLLGPCYLTISLGEEFHGYYYKLIAGVSPQVPGL